MAPLSQTQVAALLESYRQLVEDRAAIAAVLADLPESFAAVRDALNRLQRIVQRPAAGDVATIR